MTIVRKNAAKTKWSINTYIPFWESPALFSTWSTASQIVVGIVFKKKTSYAVKDFPAQATYTWSLFILP